MDKRISKLFEWFWGKTHQLFRTQEEEQIKFKHFKKFAVKIELCLKNLQVGSKEINPCDLSLFLDLAVTSHRPLTQIVIKNLSRSKTFCGCSGTLQALFCHTPYNQRSPRFEKITIQRTHSTRLYTCSVSRSSLCLLILLLIKSVLAQTWVSVFYIISVLHRPKWSQRDKKIRVKLIQGSPVAGGTTGSSWSVECS